jgi:dipeptidyl aminopeptidase/acylaminoacyl peptidase
MISSNFRLVFFLFLLLTNLSRTDSMILSAQQAKRPFTVADEIGLSLFGTPSGLPAEVHFSPDGRYFAVWSECGRSGLNLVEDSLRFYRTEDVKNLLERSDESESPPPLWIVNRSDKQGPVINDWRWLADSSGVAFLDGGGPFGDKHLILVDLRKKAIQQLTSAMETVLAFDIRDRQHYVYTVANTVEREKVQAERHPPAIVGTGLSILELLFPDDPVTARLFSRRSKYLWAVGGGKRFEVKSDGAPINPDGIALSPDGRSLVTKLPIPVVPPSWETLYPPLFASDPHRLRAGGTAHKYVRIDLYTGAIQDLTDAPVSSGAGSWASALDSPTWSSDGQDILLPGTFLKSKENAPSRPCIAVVNLPSNTRTCVEMLKGFTETGAEEGFHVIKGVRFAGTDKSRIFVTFMNLADWSIDGTTEYRRMGDGTWQVASLTKGEPKAKRDALEVTVREGINDPPMLVATNTQTSRVIWDPNPQLKNIELGDASVYTWKDKEGRDQKGGLYKPSNYKAGQRYPLVIQTHGFPGSEFKPSGFFPTAFAARALAAAGIVVLQLGERNCPYATPDSGPCAVSYYEDAARQLVLDGLVDPGRIGIIGFSASCFTVMETLTTGSLHIKAASITDGVMLTYSQFLLQPERLGPEDNSMIGAPPFGDGLQQWLKRSPGFNLDKVTAPLLVNAEGPFDVPFMWEPYAALHYLKKPVDLIMLNTDEHVLTNPAVRMASQGGTVDWFRFWLQEYEDADPAKAEQYKRWRELRKLQAENEKKSTTTQPDSN